jgi:RecA/RadA recombinase
MDGADGVKAFEKLIPENESLAAIPRVLTPNGGQHLYFSNLIDQPLGNSTGDLPPGIDIRGNGGYVIACGSLMADGRQYTHDIASPKLSELLASKALPTLPAWLLEHIQGNRLHKTTNLGLINPYLNKGDDLAKLLQALRHISPDQRDTWIKVGGALHDSVFPDGFKLWDNWSKGSLKYDAQDQLKTWQSFGRATGARATLGTIFFLASQNGFKDSHIRQGQGQKPPQKAVIKPSEVTLIQAVGLIPKPIDWLWPGWLAQGKIHILGGAPGSGKTTICMKLAAIVSSGGYWPDGSMAQAGNVVVWSGEDDAKDTLIPRLIASGADTGRIYFVGECKAGDETRSFDPSTDIEALQTAIDHIGGAALIVVDPVVNAISGDSHKNAEVRRSLQPLATLAAACKAAVVGITHLSKGTMGREPLERLTGSLAFGAVARVVMIAAKEAETEDGSPPKRFLCRVKSNIGPDDGGFNYDLIQTALMDNPAIAASHVVFGPAIDGSAREILAAAETVSDEDKSALGEAVEFLRDFLADGPKEVCAVRKAATAAGVTERTLRRAKDKLGVRNIKSAFDGPWVWRLPEVDHEGGQTLNLGRLGKIREKVGHLGRVSATKLAKLEKGQNPSSDQGGQPYTTTLQDGHEDGQKNLGKVEGGQANVFGHLGAEVGQLGTADADQDEVYL